MALDTENPVQSGRQVPRDERRRSGDETQAPGATGARRGLSGEERRLLGLTWLIAMALASMIIAINILTRRHDNPHQSLAEIVLWEGSSAVSLAVAFVICGAMGVWLRRASPPWWLQAPAHVLAAIAFSMVHVGGFVAIRTVAARLVGRDYAFGPLLSEGLYELGKDAMTYGVVAVSVWVMLGRGRAARPAAEAAVFDILDGQRLVRAPVAEILAVRSAANYAEFLLADGRRPLMRTSLGALEARLAAHGFVRTHRSCLVNPRRVTGLRPGGSGDYTVELGAIEAPLSRRFPAALAALRS